MENFSLFCKYFSICVTNLDNVLSWCEETNLLLNWEKFHLIVKEGIVVGHNVSIYEAEFDN